MEDMGTGSVEGGENGRGNGVDGRKIRGGKEILGMWGGGDINL